MVTRLVSRPASVLVVVSGLLAAQPAAAQTTLSRSAAGQVPAHEAAINWRPAGGDLFVPSLGAARDATLDQPHGNESSRLSAPEQPFARAIAEAAERHGLDPKLLHALVIVESAYRNEVCSPVGACGLTQLMPGTASDLGVRNRFDPVENLGGGADYLARQVLRFGDIRLALAAYNSGPDRVARIGRIPSITETQAYVVAVVDCYLALTAGRNIRSSRDCTAPRGRS